MQAPPINAVEDAWMFTGADDTAGFEMSQWLRGQIAELDAANPAFAARYETELAEMRKAELEAGGLVQ